MVEPDHRGGPVREPSGANRRHRIFTPRPLHVAYYPYGFQDTANQLVPVLPASPPREYYRDGWGERRLPHVSDGKPGSVQSEGRSDLESRSGDHAARRRLPGTEEGTGDGPND